MNGRSYDPVLGRFLQADPFVQAPKNSQSLNRYSYVLNNPLSYTDPSGYFVEGFLAATVVASFFNFLTDRVTDANRTIQTGDSLIDGLTKSTTPGVLPGAFGNNISIENRALFTQTSAVAATVGNTWSQVTAGNFTNGGASEAFAHAVGDLRQALDDLVFENDGGFAAFYVSRVLQEFVLVPIEDTALAISNRDYTGVGIAVLGGVFKPVGAAKKAVSALTADQATNLNRFLKRLPRNATDPVLRDLPNGGKVFQAEVPGRVPGSKAVYEKQVDASGKTIQFTKTTYDPAGNIVHVKDKQTGEVFP